MFILGSFIKHQISIVLIECNDLTMLVRNLKLLNSYVFNTIYTVDDYKSLKFNIPTYYSRYNVLQIRSLFVNSNSPFFNSLS